MVYKFSTLFISHVWFLQHFCIIIYVKQTYMWIKKLHLPIGLPKWATGYSEFHTFVPLALLESQIDGGYQLIGVSKFILRDAR